MAVQKALIPAIFQILTIFQSIREHPFIHHLNSWLICLTLQNVISGRLAVWYTSFITVFILLWMCLFTIQLKRLEKWHKENSKLNYQSKKTWLFQGWLRWLLCSSKSNEFLGDKFHFHEYLRLKSIVLQPIWSIWSMLQL